MEEDKSESELDKLIEETATDHEKKEQMGIIAKKKKEREVIEKVMEKALHNPKISKEELDGLAQGGTVVATEEIKAYQKLIEIQYYELLKKVQNEMGRDPDAKKEDIVKLLKGTVSSMKENEEGIKKGTEEIETLTKEPLERIDMIDLFDKTNKLAKEYEKSFRQTNEKLDM